jgi:two-component system, chemotaxis family, chemotaxis protein CheY
MRSSPLVLVVDDDPDILDAICDILEGERYRVARARNGLEALDRVGEELPAVILLDLMMPVMDGLAFATALRKQPLARSVPIVVISADGNPQRAAALGAAGFLAKPFDIDALLSRVSDVAGASPSPA